MFFYVTIACGAGLFVLLSANSKKSPFGPLQPFGVFICGLVAVYFFQPLQHSTQLISWYGESICTSTVICALLCAASATVGFNFLPGGRTARRIPNPQHLRPSAQLVAGSVLVAIGLAHLASNVGNSGGLETVLETGNSKSLLFGSSGNGYFELLQFTLLPGLILLLTFPHAKGRLTNPVASVGLCLGIAVTLLYGYSGSRSRVITAGLALTASFFVSRNRRIPMGLALVGIPLALGISHFLANNRAGFVGLSINAPSAAARESATSAFSTAEETSRGCEFSCSAAVLDLVPESVDYDYGYAAAEILTRFIPRPLWKEKPYPAIDSVQPIFERRNLQAHRVRALDGQRTWLTGPAFGAVGYFYRAGGALGVILGGLLLGFVYRVWERWMSDSSPSKLAIGTPLIFAGSLDAGATPLLWVTFLLPSALIIAAVIATCNRIISGERRPQPNVSPVGPHGRRRVVGDRPRAPLKPNEPTS